MVVVVVYVEYLYLPELLRGTKKIKLAARETKAQNEHSINLKSSCIQLISPLLSMDYDDILPLKNIMSNSTILGEDFFHFSQSALAYPGKKPSLHLKKKTQTQQLKIATCMTAFSDVIRSKEGRYIFY